MTLQCVLQCRDLRVSRQQSLGHHPQIHGKSVSVHSFGPAAHFLQVLGHEQWRSVHLQVRHDISAHQCNVFALNTSYSVDMCCIAKEWIQSSISMRLSGLCGKVLQAGIQPPTL